MNGINYENLPYDYYASSTRSNKNSLNMNRRLNNVAILANDYLSVLSKKAAEDKENVRAKITARCNAVKSSSTALRNLDLNTLVF